MIKGTENITIGDLISRRVPFFVPKYQRNYAWEADEVDDFIGDLSHLFDRRVGTGAAPRHFFGGVVSIDILAPNTTSGRSFELVDGQQRMATFLLTVGLLVSAFDAVAAEARLAGDTAAEQTAKSQSTLTRDNFLEYSEVVGGQLQKQFRVSLSKADSLFFQQCLGGQTATASRDSHRRLREAQSRIEAKLIREKAISGATSLTNRLDRLVALRTCLFEDCHLIHIYSDDRQEAYRLFRILNDRGRPLTDGDKLRSHTLELLEGSGNIQSVAETQWDQIVGEGDVDGFLQTYYTAQTGEKAPKRELFDQFVARILTPPVQGSQHQFIANRITAILAAKGHYDALLDGQWPYDPAITSSWKRDRLDRLMKVLRHTLCLPLLLAARETVSESVFSEVVLLLERFAFRYVSIVGGHHNPPNTVYANTIRGLRANAGAFTSSQLAADLRTIIATYAKDDVFETSLFSKLDYRQSPQRRLIKHFLTTVDDHFAWLSGTATGQPVADETRVFDVGTNTIEHIYPQNAQAAYVDPLLEPSKQLLPNLTFWGANDNQAAGNLPFAQKQPRYLQSSVLMNREIGQLAAWDATQIAARRIRLWNAARRLFSI